MSLHGIECEPILVEHLIRKFVTIHILKIPNPVQPIEYIVQDEIVAVPFDFVLMATISLTEMAVKLIQVNNVLIVHANNGFVCSVDNSESFHLCGCYSPIRKKKKKKLLWNFC